MTQQASVQGNELLSALFPVDAPDLTAELTANALREMYAAPFPEGGGQAIFQRSDKIPGLAAGDYGPSEEPGGETLLLADDSSLYVPGPSTYPRKTLVIHANDSNAKVKQLTNHAQTTKGSAVRGKPLAYQTTNRDRSGETGVIFVISRNTPKEGNHRHEFLLEYRSMYPYTSDDNPIVLDTQAPTVSGISPTTGPATTEITATGTNLDTVSAVNFQQDNSTVDTQDTYSAQDAGSLAFTPPTGIVAGEYFLQFVNPAGSVVATQTFTVQ